MSDNTLVDSSIFIYDEEKEPVQEDFRLKLDNDVFYSGDGTLRLRGIK